MSVPVILRDDAVSELEKAFDFYEQRRQGLGGNFAADIRDVLSRIEANPSSAPVEFADVRKAVVKKFPFCVFYRVRVDRIDVLAVFHTSRDPDAWKSRI